MGVALEEAAPADPYHPYDEVDEADTMAPQTSKLLPQPPVAELDPNLLSRNMNIACQI